MSKYEAQRAMKEAKYARDQARAQARRAASPRPAVAPATTTAVAAAPAASAPAQSTGTCGHRSMNGRTCTREPGHSEKSHRYS